MTVEELISRTADTALSNRSRLKKQVRQRRNGMQDLYGVEYKLNGSSSDPARFYISVSPDLVYYERFAFKLIINSISGSDFKIYIHDIDITDYLEEQHDGSWVDSAGIYPTSANADERIDFYDILDVASMMYADGRGEDAELILKPEFKEVRFKGTFDGSAFLYLKYSHLNR